MSRLGWLALCTVSTLPGCSAEGSGQMQEPTVGSEPQVDPKTEGIAIEPAGMACTFCTPQLGGETSDHDGGYPNGCKHVTTRRRIEVGEEPSPFDLGMAHQRMQRTVESSIQLEPPVADARRTDASGYSAETRVHATIQTGASYLTELDPERCSDGVCRSVDGSVEVPETHCNSYIEIEFAATLSTEDGAMVVNGQGEALYSLGREAFGGDMVTDLTTTEGTLSLSELASEGPHYGSVRVSFNFAAEATSGTLGVYLETLLEPEGTLKSLELLGRWPAGVPSDPQPPQPPQPPQN